MSRSSLQKKHKLLDRRISEEERYFLAAFSIALLGNQIPYQITRFLSRGMDHYDLSLPIDAAVPFLPWTVSIYFFGCFIFWFFLYRRAAALPRQTADRFFCANLLGKVICTLFFLFLPTAMTRPELNGSGFWILFMRIVYRLDDPYNLFPSLHCFIAWLCWTGIRGNRQVHVLWRVSALLMGIIVCISTLTTRQHVILDAAGGILLSELCWLLAGCNKIRRLYTGLINSVLLTLPTTKTPPC